MSRDQIIAKWESLTPRERDAWVAEVVFGHEAYGQFYAPNGVRVLIPHYTTDIAAAWTVFECFPYIEIARIPRETVVYGARINDNDGMVLSMIQKPTAPEAICLAAIIAKLT